VKRSIRRPGSSRLALVLAGLLLSPLASAQVAPSPDNRAGAERAAPVAAGMTADEIRQRLRDAGQSDAAIDAALQQVGRTGSATSTTGATTPRATDAGTPVPPAPAVARRDGVLWTRPADDPSAPEPFGFAMFHWSPTTFEPLGFGPVDADYPLGPGDEVALTLWGDDQLALTLTVSREGMVTLPDVGQVSVQGLTLEEAKARIRVSLAHAYSGLKPAGQRSTTFVSLSLGRLRTIQVFLLGEVERPGSYTLSSVSRVLNALYAAGGPTRNGSLREVRVLRGGHESACADLYDVILGGDPGSVARLQNGDVVFVPAAQRRAVVRGPVRRPGIYELRQGEQLRALLRLAGGPLPEAELSRAQIDRVTPEAWRDSLPGQGRVTVDVAVGALLADSTRDVRVADADTLTLFALSNRRGNEVAIDGRGIVRPGRYEYRPGMRVSDLLAAAGGLTPEAYLDNALLTRTRPDSVRVALRFAPAGALRHVAADDLELRPLDDLAIRSVWDLRERQSVTIHGNVHSPGTYELLEGMTLTDLLMKAGGFTDDADAQRAEIARITEGTTAANRAAIAETLQVALARDLTQAPAAAAMHLRPHDAVFVRRDPDYAEPTYVTLEGEVRFPGSYAIMRRDERVRDLVQRAGGLTDFAYPRGATFVRHGFASLAIDLPRALRNARDEYNLVVVPGDVIRIPRYTPTVQIEGAVYSPATALFQPGAGVGFYVTQASGFRTDADRRNVVVIAPNGHVRRHGTPEPGSRIVVPARPPMEPRDHLKEFATLMSVVASLATTVYLVHQSGR
jgi:protein involved in polysaccharide export with SLBB domain